jgi:hypothetical protein
MGENPFKPRIPLWSKTEINRRFGGLGRQVTDARPMRQLRQWFDSQLNGLASVEGYPTASPAESLAPIIEAARRGRKKIAGDDFRLYVMAALIDAGSAHNPTEAVAKLREADGWNANQLNAAKDRLVGKYNARELQDELATIRVSPDYQNLVNQYRGNHPE